MKFIFALIIIFPLLANTQTKVIHIRPIPNRTVQYENNIVEGSLIKDLDWAWNSEQNCIPKSEVLKFNGKHLIFKGVAPKYSSIEINIEPKDTAKNLSIYAAIVSKDKRVAPIDSNDIIQCGADFKRTTTMSTQQNNSKRIIQNLNTKNDDCTLIIGVVGAHGLEKADFTLKITTKTK